MKRVTGKTAVLLRIAEAAVEQPNGRVRDVVFPAAGGEQKLRDLCASTGRAGQLIDSRLDAVSAGGHEVTMTEMTEMTETGQVTVSRRFRTLRGGQRGLGAPAVTRGVWPA